MWYKNIAGRLFGLVTKHACHRRRDGGTERITTPKTALALLRRALKTSLAEMKYVLVNTQHTVFGSMQATSLLNISTMKLV